jgi:hypothetical protein
MPDSFNRLLVASLAQIGFALGEAGHGKDACRGQIISRSFLVEPTLPTFGLPPFSHYSLALLASAIRHLRPAVRQIAGLLSPAAGAGPKLAAV